MTRAIETLIDSRIYGHALVTPMLWYGKSVSQLFQPFSPDSALSKQVASRIASLVILVILAIPMGCILPTSLIGWGIKYVQGVPSPLLPSIKSDVKEPIKEVQQSESKNLSLLDLPNELLLKIFENLSMKDAISFSSICKTTHAVYHLQTRRLIVEKFGCQPSQSIPLRNQLDTLEAIDQKRGAIVLRHSIHVEKNPRDLEYGTPIIQPISKLKISLQGNSALSLQDKGSRVLLKWDLSDPTPLYHILKDGENQDDEKRIVGFEISANGFTAAVACSNRTIEVWDLKTNTLSSVLEGHTDGISSLQITADGSQIISGSYDSTIRVWDLIQKTSINVLKIPYPINMFKITRTASHVFAASCYPQNLLYFGNRQQNFQKQITNHDEYIKCLEISLDESKCISLSKDEIQVFDVQRGQKIHHLIIQDKENHSTDFCKISADGRRLITRSFRRLLIWDLENGLLLKELRNYEQLLLTPDGKKAIVIDSNRLRIWNLRQDTLSADLPVESSTKLLSISPDGMGFYASRRTEEVDSQESSLNHFRHSMEHYCIEPILKRLINF